MKLELNKGEVATVVNIRAWSKAFGKMQKFMSLVFLGPVVVVLAAISMLLGCNSTVAAIFLVIGLLITAGIPNVIKKFKKAKKEILDKVVAEEHSGGK
jgi:hypothetical protein